MKTTTALSILATLAATAQAHPHHLSARQQGGSKEAAAQFGTCSFDRTTAFTTPGASNPPVSRRQTSSTNSSSTWSPPSSMSAALDSVWEHEMSTYGGDPLTFKNYGYDQIMETKGNIQYCVRWDSTKSVTAAQRASIATALQKQFTKWVDAALKGFDGFPYEEVKVSVVGWATNNTALLEGASADGVTVYSSTADDAGIPECDPACGRAIHYADGDYSGCAGGDAARYDVSLWLTDGLDGGFGGDWGQQVGTDYMLDNLDAENIHILLHEMGHTLALDDFYDWTPEGQSAFIMLAGSAMEITEFDAWMARDWWRHIKSRYSL
ncbi:hypothetical protein GTA08_BOTSDO03612 [Neofusicoccum parvum]|uniref:Cellulose-binding family II n=3 Tax=Neofusicoccum TaxID=407951 RepID=A0ABR3T914_9PEZI|nr:putative cellulose-binding family ii protein [Neofusicoccum parvum UCRNP2]GME26173.1 hypothetical protein GTA08_BOTSDO03612 [Neofusicoccum parvum]GME35505.1 hypothetical protein GTA08_BOTSDO03612 [Neofusicoccum parvum]